MTRIATRARPAYAGRDLPASMKEATPFSLAASGGAVSAAIRVVDNDTRAMIDAALAKGSVVQCKPSRKRTV